MVEPKLCYARILTKEYPRDPVSGKPLCRYCKGPLAGRRTSFCSDKCVHEFRLRTDAGYVRQIIFQRDKGVCAKCGTDTEKLRFSCSIATWDRQNREPKYRVGRETAAAYHERHSIWTRQRSVTFSAFMKRAHELFDEGWPSPERSWWDADHIVEVRDGGGCCDLANYQTLCVPCHKEKTIRRTCTRL